MWFGSFDGKSGRRSAGLETCRGEGLFLEMSYDFIQRTSSVEHFRSETHEFCIERVYGG